MPTLDMERHHRHHQVRLGDQGLLVTPHHHHRSHHMIGHQWQLPFHHNKRHKQRLCHLLLNKQHKQHLCQMFLNRAATVGLIKMLKAKMVS